MFSKIKNNLINAQENYYKITIETQTCTYMSDSSLSSLEEDSNLN